jgi:hypothetical protein
VFILLSVNSLKQPAGEEESSVVNRRDPLLPEVTPDIGDGCDATR